jgi:hypothetical protein
MNNVSGFAGGTLFVWMFFLSIGVFSLPQVDAGSDKSRVNTSDILAGGPPKDGIPAIDKPHFDTPQTTPFRADELVLGIVVEGEARAYPYAILNWHEIVNDTIHGKPISVAFCPLCDTGIAFERVVGSKKTTFGVSGKLYQSCLVMYDRATETLWSQPWGTGIVGEHTDRNLSRIPLVKTTLGKWVEKYPDTKILSPKTGHIRDYFDSPYKHYAENPHLYFPVRNLDGLKGNFKEGITIVFQPDGSAPPDRYGGKSVRFINSEIKREKSVDGRLGDLPVRAVWDDALQTVKVYEVGPNGELGSELPSTPAFAFVYPAFFQ